MLRIIPTNIPNGFEDLQTKGVSLENFVDALVVLGANKSIAEQDMKEVNDLSSAIGLLRKGNSQMYTVKPSQMDLKSLQKKFNDVNWVKLIGTFVSKSSIVISENTTLYFQENMLENLMELMKSTTPRAAANLIALDLLANGIHAILPAEAEKLLPPKEFVSLQTTVVFQVAVASLYVTKTFDKEKRKKAQKLVDDSLKEMKMVLSEIKWMDNTTKSKAINKANEMLTMVGYNDEIIDKNQVKKFYDIFLEKFWPNSLINNEVIAHSNFIKDYKRKIATGTIKAT